jgi:tRNA (guanine10-N2)-dimethyltransferase
MRVAFLLSGEHPEIPKEEVKATLEALGVRYETLREMKSCLLLDLESFEGLPHILSERLSFTRSFGKLLGLFHCSEFPGALNELEKIPISGRFKATCVRIEGSCEWIGRKDLEERIGGWVIDNNEGAKVDLENPEIEIIAVITSDHVVIYLKEGEVDRSLFKVKEVSARPYAHPASMRPTLARAMVNLARTRRGDLVLDPFLGVGGIALEILSVGARLIGVDINEKLVIQAKNNLMTYGFLEGYELRVGDALSLELGVRVDRIVTDPPYGRMSSSPYAPRELASKFISKVPDYLRRGGWISISLPKEFLDRRDFEDAGIDIVNFFDLREHRSLVRRIWVGKLP